MNAPYHQGLCHAWDTGAEPFGTNPYPRGSDDAKAYYLGHREGCTQVAEHRREIGAA